MAVKHWIATLILAMLMFVVQNQRTTILEGVIKLLRDGGTQIDLEPEDMPEILDEYDFVVVGAGTAGCVLANRLSENPNWNVLLIEAGRPENFIMDMPILANYLQFTESNWRYMTEPSDQFCMGMDNQQCHWPRGKVMGGSSVLNYMIYTRGNWRDYNNWAKLGNVGWSYDEVLPYFKKIENFTVPGPYDPAYHSKDGYLGVSYAPYKTKIADAIIESSIQNGIKYVDYNGRRQVGVSQLQVSMRDGVRESSSRAYLHPISGRPNLHVKKYSMVSKILIDKVTKRATGVEFYRSKVRYEVRARKEVIVSAGAINSPQLLMLSGIGPNRHLTQMGIKTIANLRVGFNLMDHIALGGLTFLIDKPYGLNTDRMISVDNLNNYLNHHKGPLSVPGGCEVLVFHDFDHPNDPDGYPDMELLFQGGSIVSDPVLYKDFGITDELYQAVYKPIENRDTFMVFPMLMRPKSKGRIVVRSLVVSTLQILMPRCHLAKLFYGTLP